MNTNRQISLLFSLPLSLFLLALSFGACQSEQNQNQPSLNQLTDATTDISTNEQTARAKFVIHKPFKEIAEAQQNVAIKHPEKAQTIRLQNGAFLKIPAYAYQTAQGDTVREPVQIKYTAYQDVAAIIAAGIPMKYRQPDGSVEWMQTGGMFEIEGHTSKGPVQLFEGKEMEVSILSNTPGAFDFWSFDEEIGNWKNLQKDQQPISEVVQNEVLEQEIRQLQSAVNKKPVNPETQQANKLIFNDLNLKKCPKLKGGQPIALTYAGTDKSKDPQQKEWKNKVWYKKELKPIDAQQDLYQLTLFGDELYSIPVKIALQGPALQAAIDRYRSLLKAHQAKVNLLEKKKTIRQQQAAFRRTVSVSGFGLYNHDILTNSFGTRSIAADFDFGATYNDFKEDIDLFFVTGVRDMVVQLPQYAWKEFRYNPKWETQLVAVLPDDKVATFSQNDFDEAAEELAAASGKQYEFKMKVKDQQILTVADLKEVLADKEPIEPKTRKQQAVNVSVYPNPAVHTLNIELSSLAGQSGSIYLSNNNGQLVKELTVGEFATEPIQMQVGQYPIGPYYLVIAADNKTVASKKVIIQR